MFIELHDQTGRVCSINTAFISSFCPVGSNCNITFSVDGDSYVVKESYEQVKSLLGVSSIG